MIDIILDISRTTAITGTITNMRLEVKPSFFPVSNDTLIPQKLFFTCMA